MVTGVAGTQADTDRNKGAKDVFKKNPGIKVVAKYTGMWDSATAQRNTAAAAAVAAEDRRRLVLGRHRRVLKAIHRRAGRPLPTVVGGEGENGFRKFLVGYHGQEAPVRHLARPAAVPRRWSRSSWRGRCSRSRTRAEGRHLDARSRRRPRRRSKLGETVFPNVPDSFFDDFTDSGPNATVKICVQARAHRQGVPGDAEGERPVGLATAPARGSSRS